MPKSIQSSSPSVSHSKPLSDDHTSRLSDLALRKKKNADAQAAFRARRANYIATLEETGHPLFLFFFFSLLTHSTSVTSLESVVLQLQDSCRQSSKENNELRNELVHLRHENRHWRVFYQARKTMQGPPRPENDHLPPPPPSIPYSTPLPTTHLESPHIHQYTNEAFYRTNDEPLCNGPYNQNNNYPNHSPTIPYVGQDHDSIQPDPSSHPINPHRVSPKYVPYQYPIPPSNRDSPWPRSMAQTTSSGGDSGPPTSNNSSSHSPGFVESPTLTSSEMSYVGRYPVEDQKVSLTNLDSAPYVFDSSRSLSPSSSTPPSSSSTSLTSPFQFTFPDNSIPNDRPEFDYRRQSNHSHTAEVTLHGGTADISLAASPACDAVRYRLGARRANSGPEPPLLPALPTISGSDTGSLHERGSSEGEPVPYSHHARLRPRRATLPSRSTSPDTGCPPISGTLAVIKAQAFGALRRTRARTKRSSEGAAKVALNVLEARGIGMDGGLPTGSKRPRLQDDEGDMQT